MTPVERKLYESSSCDIFMTFSKLFFTYKVKFLEGKMFFICMYFESKISN